jgi:hypothetical protein
VTLLFLGGTPPDAAPDLTLATGPSAIVGLGDMDGDGLADSLLDWTLYLGATPPDAVADETFMVSSPSAAGDTNGDGFADLIGGSSLHLGSDPINTTTDATLSSAGNPRGVGDANGDGFADIVYGDSSGGSQCGGTGGRPGRAYLYFGAAPPDTFLDVTFAGSCSGTTGEQLGRIVAPAHW